MKKILSFFSLAVALANFSAQTNVYAYGFDTAFPSGWTTTNQSSPTTTSLWTKANYTTPLSNPLFGSGNTTTVPSGQSGGNNSFALVNYTSTSGAGTISNWLITSAIDVQDGDIVSFYSRKGTDGTTDYPDRLELRYSTAATSVNPSTGSADLGTFTNLGVTVNPSLAGGFVYPKTWTKYSFTVSGVGTTPKSVKFAFRYFVTDGGPSGSNSDLIGIDTFSINRPNLAVADSQSKDKTKVYPNPAKNFISVKTAHKYSSVKIYNIAGQLISEVPFDSEKSIDVSKLKNGTYILEASNGSSKESFKFIKE